MDRVMAAAALGAVVSFLWSAAAPRVGSRLGLVDHPGAPLKVHTSPAAPLGGVGLYAALIVAAVVVGEPQAALLVAAGVVFVLGLVDDRRGLSPGVRLGVEFVAGGLTAWALGLGGIAGILVALGVVVGINAVNLFDGLDGLVVSVALITLVGMGLVGLGQGRVPVAEAALAGALVGFGVFNWHPAKVFLGDNGSYLIGLMLVAFGSRLDGGNEVGIVAGGSMFGVLLVDLAATVLRRRRAGVPLFEGDRSHLYDRLRERGVGVPRVALAAAAAQGVLTGVVVGAWWIAGPGLAAVAGVVVVVLGVAAALRWG